MARFSLIHPPESRGETRLFAIILALSGLGLLILVIYYLLNPRDIVGDALVNSTSGTPTEFPPPGFFPFYVKPVTIMFVCVVLFSYSFFALVSRFAENKLPRWLFSLFLVLSVLLLSISVYETLFNFVLWGSALAKNPDPDLAFNAYPISTFKVNLVFATKSFVALIFVSYFAISTFKSLHDRGKS